MNKQLAGEYESFLDNIVERYKGHTFYFSPKGLNYPLVLQGREGSKLFFSGKEIRKTLVGIEDFLTMQEGEKTPSQSQPKCTDRENPYDSNRAAFLASAEKDREEIATWPKWKQNALGPVPQMPDFFPKNS
jgi:hypothetical protein